MGETHPFVSASISQGFMFGAMSLGLDPCDFFRRVGLDIKTIEDVDSLVPYEKHMEVSRLILTHQSGTNSSLHIGKHFGPKRFGLLGHVMRHGATFEQALADFGRFQHLTENVYIRKLSRVPEGIRVTVESHPAMKTLPDFLAVPSRHEAPLTVPLMLARHLTGKRITPLRVSFRHKPMGDPSEHEEFYGAPVQFGMQADEMIFAQETLDIPLLESDNVKYRRALDLVLTHVDPTADLKLIGATLRQRLLQSLHQAVPKISVMARVMGMSTRTLQRRLDGEGTSFESVLDAARRDLALQHLVDPAISSYEIAGLVGFTEPSPFFRAFRRWFGCTPKEWRHKYRIT